MNLKETDFINFISCPIKYLVCRNNKTPEKDTYNKILHSTYNSIIFDYKYEGIQNLDEKIKKKWDKICFKNQDIISPKQVINGWGLLYRVYEYLLHKRPEIIDVNVPYNIEIEGTGHSLLGQINMISTYGDNMEILVPSFSKTMPESYVIDLNIKHTIDAYVIKKIYNKDTFITYRNYNLNKDKYTLRNNRDFNRLELMIKNIGTCIENDILYPHTGYHCTSCITRSICTDWGKDFDKYKDIE